AMVAIVPARGRSMMSNGTSSALNSEQDLASIPTAQRGLSRLAIARLKRAGVPVRPLLRRTGHTPEVIAKPEERLSVRGQITRLDEAAIAWKGSQYWLHAGSRFRSARTPACMH